MSLARLAIVVVMGCLPTSAEASCPSGLSGSGELSEEDARARTRAIERELDRERHKAAWWNWTWTGVYGALTGASVAIVIASDDDDTQVDFAVLAAKSVLGMAATRLLPLRVPRPASVGSTCGDLSVAESELLRAVKNERRGKRFAAHAVPIAVNLAALLYVGLSDGRWVDASISAAAGIAVAETRIFTQPFDAADILEEQSHPPARVSLAPILIGGRPGLGVAGTF